MPSSRLTLLLFAAALALRADEVIPVRNNPLLQPNGTSMPVFDAALERIGADFYLIGTGQPGILWKGTDLYSWKSNGTVLVMENYPAWVDDPANVFANSDGYGADTYSRFGAGGLLLWNGAVFYTFNGVGLGYGSVDAARAGGRGVFKHANLDQPHSRGIDAEYFVDPDGRLFYHRKVNPQEPQPKTGAAAGTFSSPAVLVARAGTPFQPEADIKATNPDGMRLVLWGEKGEWFYYDKANFEGPKLYYARGRRYLYFVGNVLSARAGLYQTGVAVGVSIENLGNGKKLPLPVMGRNFEAQLIHWSMITPTAEHAVTSARLRTSTPVTDGAGRSWTDPDFTEDAAWSTVPTGYGNPTSNRDVAIRGLNTNWKTTDAWDKVYLRREFSLAEPVADAVLRYRLEGAGSIRVNGQLVASVAGSNMNGYANYGVPRSWLRGGRNVVTVELSRKNTAGTAYAFVFADFGVYRAPHGFRPDVTGYSQPNPFRGQNGFEQWIGGKAFWDGDNSQGVERAFYFADGVHVEGQTSAAEPGPQLAPALPGLLDRFDVAGNPGGLWSTVGSEFSVAGGVLRLTPSAAGSVAWLPDPARFAAENYYWHAAFRFDQDRQAGAAGIVLWRADESNFIRAVFDDATHLVRLQPTFDGVAESEVGVPIPDGFEFLSSDVQLAAFGQPLHFVELYKNGAAFRLKLDNYWLAGAAPVLVEPRAIAAGVPGLFATGRGMQFDDVVFTEGWEEWDDSIRDWTVQAGAATSGGGGLSSAATGVTVLTKGDRLREYEFHARLRAPDGLPTAGEAGLDAAVFADGDRITVTLDYATGEWKVARGDATLGSVSARHDEILGFARTAALQTGYTYSLPAPARVSAVRVLWNDDNNAFLGQNFNVPPLSALSFSGSVGGSATAFGIGNADTPAAGTFGDIAFATPAVADRITLTTSSSAYRPWALAVRQEVAADNFVRVVRVSGRILIWLNHEFAFDLEDPRPAEGASVGLRSEDVATVFNDIACFGRAPNTMGRAEPAADAVGTSIRPELGVYVDAVGASVPTTDDLRASWTRAVRLELPLTNATPITASHLVLQRAAQLLDAGYAVHLALRLQFASTGTRVPVGAASASYWQNTATALAGLLPRLRGITIGGADFSGIAPAADLVFPADGSRPAALGFVLDGCDRLAAAGTPVFLGGFSDFEKPAVGADFFTLAALRAGADDAGVHGFELSALSADRSRLASAVNAVRWYSAKPVVFGRMSLRAGLSDGGNQPLDTTGVGLQWATDLGVSSAMSFADAVRTVGGMTPAEFSELLATRGDESTTVLEPMLAFFGPHGIEAAYLPLFQSSISGTATLDDLSRSFSAVLGERSLAFSADGEPAANPLLASDFRYEQALLEAAERLGNWRLKTDAGLELSIDGSYRLMPEAFQLERSTDLGQWSPDSAHPGAAVDIDSRSRRVFWDIELSGDREFFRLRVRP